MLLLLLLLVPVVPAAPALVRRFGTTGFVAAAMLWALGLPTVLSIAARLGTAVPPLLDPRYALNRGALVIGLAVVVAGSLRRSSLPGSGEPLRPPVDAVPDTPPDPRRPRLTMTWATFAWVAAVLGVWALLTFGR